VRPEIDARRRRKPFALQQLQRETLAVSRALRIGVERTGWLCGNLQSRAHQGRNEKIAPALEFAPAAFEDLQAVRRKTGQRRVLRHRGRADGQVLRHFLEIAHAFLRQYDPTQAPAGHAEILGKAVHHDDLAGQPKCGRGRASIRQALIDLVHDQHACARGNEARDLRQLFRCDRSSRRVRWRAEQQAARAAPPGGAHHFERRLEVGRGRNLERPGNALEGAHHVAIAGIARIRDQYFVSRIDVEREREQQAA